MQYGYVVKISNKIIYREVQLPTDAKYTKIGTELDCDVRFYKESFFDSFALTLKKQDEVWVVSCSDNIYLDVGDVRKLVTKPLIHGDSFSVKYQNSETELFKVEFLFDFDNEKKDYSRTVDISSVNSFTIGSDAACSIVLRSTNIKNDLIELTKTSQGLVLNIIAATYGIYINGKKASTGDIIHNIDFFSIAEFSFYFKNNTIKTSKKVLVNSLPSKDEFEMGAYPKFIRNARIHLLINEDTIEILDPAVKPEKPKSNLVMSMLPSMGMMLTAGAMIMMSAQGGNSSWTMMMFSGVSAGMAIITAVVGFFDNKKSYKKSIQKRIDDYNDYIARKKEEIQKARETEKDQMENVFFSTDKELDMLYHFSPEIFDRQSTDWDYLFVRLGNGDVLSKQKIEHKKQEKLELEDDIQQMPEQVKEEFMLLKNAPVVCDFKNANAVCICGNEPFRFELFKIIVFDISIRQFYTDVSLMFVCEEKNKEKINWLRFLPHVHNDVTNSRNIVCDDESKTRLFDYLYKELSQREVASKNNNEVLFNNHIVMFLYDEYGFQSHPVSRFVSSGSKLGITFVFMMDNKTTAPEHCSLIIDVDSYNNGTLIDTSNMNSICEFNYRPISDETAQDTVRLFAPIYTEDVSLESSLTKSITLFEMMKILMVEDIDLRTNWKNSHVYKSMAAPIGVTKSDYVYLDLHDKAHGPHGLVAGTTGSGKSELLQTYILSVATLYHPYEVSFVIIDFKGGGMVNQFSDLPHLLGAITNIDGKEIDRSLKSIKAELQKRQRLFAEAEVNHIDKYIKKYQAGQASTPIPHLILIVDEFAELKAEQPEFMKELISAARIGRSLGVHLILATQKPSGQVDDQIWSNSRFKLCLKVQGVEDSNEVLKSPLAAEIKEPGRAYLQVGNNEIFELFQSAYSGAPEIMADTDVKEFSIYEISESGKRTQVFQQKRKKHNAGNLTQLEAIVEHIHSYCEKERIDRLPNICLPSLPTVISQPKSEPGKAGFIDIGLYDDPDNQVQESSYIDINNKNTLIVGASQYGKTNLLQSIIKSIASKSSPSEAVFYILDFGSMVLKNFETLNHVGGVVTSSDDEKLKNLFKLLFEEINNRKEKLLAVGVSSFVSYIEAGYKDLPHIYVMVDNYTALAELYLENDDSLLTIIREGISFGISTIIANSQTSGIGYKYMSNFANKIVLYCNDSNEYTGIFDHVTVKPDEKPGRCILEIDKHLLECQTYLAFEGDKEIDRVSNMRSFISKTNAEYTEVHAKQIPSIPNVLTREALTRDFGAVTTRYTIPIGLSYESVKPFFLNLEQIGIIGITGRENFGHKNLVSYILNTMLGNPYYSSHIVIFDDVSRKFAEYKNDVDCYSLNTEIVITIIKEWHKELDRRYNQMLMEENWDSDNELLLMVIQNNDVAAKIQSDLTVLDMFNEMLTRYHNMGICVIFANYPNSPVSYDAPDPIRMVRQNQHVICLDDLQNMKCFDPPYEAIRDNKKPVSLGDGYYINNNNVVKLKIISAEE